jgi:hypothetical protein
MVDPLKTEISVPDSRQSGALLDVGSARGKNKRSLGRSGGGTGDTTAVEDPALARTQVTRDRGEVSDGGDETREEDVPDEITQPPPDSSVGLTAVELATAVAEARATYAELGGADKGTIWAALGLMGSTLAPFVGVPGDPWRPGVMAGGWALVLMAVWALQLVGARVRALGIMEGGGGELAQHEDGTLRRISLLQLCAGALATTYTLYLGALHLWFMDARTVTGVRLQPILRPGLAVALFFATGLAYAGLARFRADARRRRGQ